MNATSKTVRRGTKRYRSILETAHDVTVYTLDNYFRGAPCNPLALVQYMGTEGLMSGRCKLTESDGRFKLRVHSNLWFEFGAQA